MPRAISDFIGLRFYFWSNEKSGENLEPVHIHISRGKQTSNATKVWLREGRAILAHNGSDLSQKELSKALIYIEANYSDIVTAWYEYFVITKENEED